MAYLFDTNVLLRIIQPHHLMFEQATMAVETLLEREETVCICPQNVREFWNVCTRPAEHNGLGLTLVQTVKEVRDLENRMTFLPDNPAVYTEWLRLVETHGITGVQVHDTNLVASMNVHNITHLLTFNPAHFHRFPGITVVHPNDLALAASPLPNGQTP